MKRLLSIYSVCLLAGSCIFVSAEESINNGVVEPSNKSIHFFKSQVANNRSIGTALNSLLKRYPDKTAEFVAVAFAAYPDDYEEIISSSVSSNPNFIDEIIMVATQHEVASPTRIVEIAVNAEPSYAEDVTRAACKYSPLYFDEIVKIAVLTEPDSADRIAQRLVKAYPSKTMEILVTTIKEVPFVGKYVLDALLATVLDDEDKSNDMIIISVEQLAQHPDAIERLVELAQQHQIDSEKVRSSALKGGLDEASIAAIIERHYLD
ncbi:hypothetical protein [Glaciecola sp. SC05]|uniref:hypothetical protein n=1 Tax=Glaciecola sp. SC05 TaxID=1987355 RepID=UPI003526F8C8